MGGVYRTPPYLNSGKGVIQINGIRPEVRKFAELMEYKLKENDHKQDWKSLGQDSWGWFLSRLREEVEELNEALYSGRVRDIMEEAADVANFAMMIVDIHVRGGNGSGVHSNRVEYPEGKSVQRQVCSEGLQGLANRNRTP